MLCYRSVTGIRVTVVTNGNTDQSSDQSFSNLIQNNTFECHISSPYDKRIV